MKNNLDLSKYQAIVSDFDGTLAGNDWKITKDVQDAIKEWINKGKHFSICTGKQFKHIKDACDILKLTDPQIVRGGSEIVDPKTGNIIHSEYINENDLEELVNKLNHSNIPFTAESGNILYTPTGEPMAEVPGVMYKKISDMNYHYIAKIVLWTDNVPEKLVEEFVKSNLSQLNSIEIIKSYTPFQKTWQITSKLGTKYHAVLKLAKILGISSNLMIGIGDSYNDEPLLKACGYKIAMENAPDSLKKIADFVAPSYSENGVAVVINNII